MNKLRLYYCLTLSFVVITTVPFVYPVTDAIHIPSHVRMIVQKLDTPRKFDTITRNRGKAETRKYVYHGEGIPVYI